MNKAELIEALSAHYDGSKTEAAKALNAVVQTITYKTAAGEKVSITGFGVFEKVHRSARMVRNPRTGERKQAKATAVPRFRAGTDLKAYVSGAKKVPRTAAKKATPAKTTTTATTAKAPAKPLRTSAANKTAAKTTAKKAPPGADPARSTSRSRQALSTWSSAGPLQPRRAERKPSASAPGQDPARRGDGQRLAVVIAESVAVITW